MLSIDPDVFSSGQITSKIWLCENLENLQIDEPQVIWVYGGWAGMLSFLLLSRNTFPIKHIRSFDIDPVCEKIADTVLGNWVWKKWKFKAFTKDCNEIDFLNNNYGERPDIVINTSSEHFVSDKWFDNIPINTMVVIQSNNMKHNDHFSCVESLEDLKNKYKLSTEIMSGDIRFDYPDWGFNRYMIIGKK